MRSSKNKYKNKIILSSNNKISNPSHKNNHLYNNNSIEIKTKKGMKINPKIKIYNNNKMRNKNNNPAKKVKMNPLPSNSKNKNKNNLNKTMK